MPDDITSGFETETITLDLDRIVPLKMLSKSNLESRKFKQIVASIKELGIIEPLVVSRQMNKGAGKKSDKSERYMLLDGHMRLEALKQMGETSTVCLVSTDDESFTYNKYISRQPPVQENKMIETMLKDGVPEEKIARALNINVRSIILKRKMLDGICKEAIRLLEDKMLAASVFRYLKKMKPARQIECAMLMVDMNDFTVRYAQALFESTKDDGLVNPEKPKAATKGLSAEKRTRMQDDLERVSREYKLVKDDRGQKNLVLQFTKNYLGRLLDNARVVRFLERSYPDILEEFQKIADMTSLKGGNTQQKQT